MVLCVKLSEIGGMSQSVFHRPLSLGKLDVKGLVPRLDRIGQPAGLRVTVLLRDVLQRYKVTTAAEHAQFLHARFLVLRFDGVCLRRGGRRGGSPARLQDDRDVSYGYFGEG